MGDYTKLKIADVQTILALYNDDKVESLRALSLGISNSNYEVKTDKSHYLLKVSNDKNIEEVQREMEILDFLSAKKYPYSLTPHHTKSNLSVYECGQYYGVLFPFLQGIPPGPSDDTCFEIGKALAKLHMISGEFIGLRDSKEISLPPSFIKDYIKQKECPKDFKEAYHSLVDDSYFKYEFQRGVIHGDLYYDNTLFDQNHLSAVLDFEQSGVGEFIFDLGISLSGSCLEKGRISAELIKSYLKGYESIRPIPDEERDILYQAVIWGLLSISLWRIKRFTIGNLNPLMADSYKELLHRAMIFKEHINDI